MILLALWGVTNSYPQLTVAVAVGLGGHKAQMTTQLARNDACRVPKGRRGRDGGGDGGGVEEDDDGGAKVDKVAKTPSLLPSHAGGVGRPLPERFPVQAVRRANRRRRPTSVAEGEREAAGVVSARAASATRGRPPPSWNRHARGVLALGL